MLFADSWLPQEVEGRGPSSNPQKRGFEAFSHNHANEEDRSVVFKTYVRHAMDEIIGRSRRIGPKQLRTDLAENIGYNNPDLPNRNQVGYPTCLFTLKYFV